MRGEASKSQSRLQWQDYNNEHFDGTRTANFGCIKMLDSRTPRDATLNYFSPEGPEGR